MLPYLSFFFGGLFLSNAVPHLVAGITGRAFPSPFAKPPGRGLSSSKVNVVWGFANVLAGYLLVFHVGSFDVHSGLSVAVVGSGALLKAIGSAHQFGKVNGGNSPGAAS